MAYDYSKLCGKIRERYRTQGAFAEALGVRESTLSNKINNHTDWKRREIELACDLLGIPLSDVSEYFFTPKVVISQLCATS